jgi:phosphatidylserine/phosphatidylglycerophosphate/cardiolipin synthase-like enzyme
MRGFGPALPKGRSRWEIDWSYSAGLMRAAAKRPPISLPSSLIQFPQISGKSGPSASKVSDPFGDSSPGAPCATPASFFDRLKAAGVVLVEFHPINPLNPPKLNERDHRKILIADGTTAIVGGVNLSSAYESHPFAKLAGSAGKPTSDYWRDTDLEIMGPAVTQLQQLFLQHWASEGGTLTNAGNSTVSVPEMGSQIIRVIGSTSDDVIPRYYATLLSAIRKAEKTIWVTTAYFVPTEDEREDLIHAARRRRHRCLEQRLTDATETIRQREPLGMFHAVLADPLCRVWRQETVFIDAHSSLLRPPASQQSAPPDRSARCWR